LTRDEYQKALENLVKEGYRMTWISAHEFGGQPRYASIYEKKPGPLWRVQSGITATDLQNLIDELAKDGMQPVHLYGYARGGAANFAAIFEQSSDPARIVKYDVPRDEFQKVSDDYFKQGYWRKGISGYFVGQTESWAGMWEKRSGSFAGRSNLTLERYLSISESFSKQGYRMILLTAFAAPGGPKFNTSWEK